MKALVFGCGYLGRRVAARWMAQGHEVAALTRSPGKAEELRAAGIGAVLGDVTDRGSLEGLPAADVVLYSVGYDRAAGRDRRRVVVEGLRNALDALAGTTEWLVFVSTTSVYGQSSGEWIDEESATEPVTESGRLALEAEHLLNRQSATRDPQSVILRFSGLYGPGRLLRRIEQFRAGEPIAGDGEAWLNLIHVDDAATAVLLAAERLLNQSRDGRGATPAETFLVSDDLPMRRREYYGRLAELTGSPPPVFDPSAEGRSAGLGKRCRNERVKRELGLTLAYPTFEDGLIGTLRVR
jgi:nucleoside-diphosphate-sugar epimerase